MPVVGAQGWSGVNPPTLMLASVTSSESGEGEFLNENRDVLTQEMGKTH